MGHIRVKTTYSIQGAYASTETETLYCHHYLSTDSVIFYDKYGEIQSMIFNEWESGNDLWDAVNRLMFPFEDSNFNKLKDKVEYYHDDEFKKR